MTSLQKTAATMATFALLLPSTALAGHGHGNPEKHHNAAAPSQSDPAATDPADSAPAATDPSTTPKADTPPPSGKAGAPGRVCKSLKVKGKKTPEQRAAHKKCIHDAVAKRQSDKAAADDSEPSDPTAPATPAA